MRILMLSLAGLALAACSAGGPPELTASLQTTLPGPGLELGGSVDSVTYDEVAGLVTITGWHMFTPETRSQDLKVYAVNATGIESVTSMERPDVAAALNNEDLLNSGYRLVLRTEPFTPLTELCISMTDKHYDARLLNPHDAAQVRCTSLGQ
ncbi:MAG: hypothetical protein RLO80_00885 [Hyphomonas sp.]